MPLNGGQVWSVPPSTSRLFQESFRLSRQLIGRPPTSRAQCRSPFSFQDLRGPGQWLEIKHCNESRKVLERAPIHSEGVVQWPKHPKKVTFGFCLSRCQFVEVHGSTIFGNLSSCRGRVDRVSCWTGLSGDVDILPGSLWPSLIKRRKMISDRTHHVAILLQLSPRRRIGTTERAYDATTSRLRRVFLRAMCPDLVV